MYPEADPPGYGSRARRVILYVQRGDMTMIEIYDNARTVLRACDDLDAISAVIEAAETGDDAAARACLAVVRCALTAVTADIRTAAGAIADAAQP